jgi:hypothetical protein
MVQSLKDYLQDHAKKVHDGKGTITEWRTAIEKLFNEIRAWINESDPDGLMQIDETEQDVNEPGIGRYPLPHLNLGLLGRWIQITPKSRQFKGKGADGRVDMTNMVITFILYRKGRGNEENWFIEGPHGDPMASPWANIPDKKLDRSTFEDAMMKCLR